MCEAETAREARLSRLPHVDHMPPKSPRWIPGIARAQSPSLAGVVWPDARVDALIETYVEWREESEAVAPAYERWTGAERSDRALAYAAYRATLEREEKAAVVYQLAATRLVGAARGR